MAEDREKEVVIDIKINTEDVRQKLADVNTEIDSLKKTNKALSDQMKANGKQFGVNAQVIAQNEKQIKLLKGQSKSLEGQLQNQVKTNQAVGDSYYEINAVMLALQKEYKSLSKAQREGAGGQELLKQINQQKQALKEVDQSMGDFHRNVGNYSGSLAPHFEKLNGLLSKLGTNVQEVGEQGFTAFKNGIKSSITSVKAFGKTLLTTPLGWLLAGLTAVVAVFNKLHTAIERNDYAGTELEKMFASLKPVTVFINKIFEKLANTLGWIASKVSDVIAGFSDQAKAQQELVVQADNLEEKERQYTKNKAERERKIAELRANSVLQEEYTAEERLKMIDEAGKLELQNLEEAKKIAKEKLEIRKKEAENLADTSDATTNEIAQMEADVINLDTEYARHMRKLNAQRTTFTREMIADQKRAKDEAVKIKQEQIKEEERIAKERQDAEAQREAEEKQKQLELASQIEDYRIKVMEEGYEKERALRELENKRELEELDEKYRDKTKKEEEQSAEYLEFKKLLLEEQQNELNALKEQEDERKAEIDAKEKEEEDKRDKEAIQKRLEKQTDYLNSFDALMGGISEMSKALGKDEKEQAKMQKVLALGKVAVQTGIAIATGVAKAQELGFPAAIPVTITTIASVLANMATAIATINQAKFATGGIVGGSSYEGDKVPVRVNSGEMILNKGQQAELFNIANGGGTLNGNMFAGMEVAMGNALKNQKAPVMIYKEFEEFTGNVATFEEVSTIK